MADITFTGHIGNDVRDALKFTQSGVAVLSLSVAEGHRKRDQSGTWQDDGTTWWRVSVWDKQGEALVEALNKGDRVLITGQVRSREWEKDGETRTSYDVKARHVALIPKAGRPQQQVAGGGQPADPWATPAATFTNEAPF